MDAVSENESRTFVSHSSADQAIAEQICDYLDTRGYKCWISSRDIPVGKSYDDEIVVALNACRSVMLILSHASVKSKHVAREVFLACERDAEIIPIRIEPVELDGSLEYQIGRTQRIDLFPAPIDQHLPRLFEQLSLVSHSPTSHDTAKPPGNLLTNTSETDADSGSIFNRHPISVAITIACLLMMILGFTHLFIKSGLKGDPVAKQPAHPVEPVIVDETAASTSAGSVLRLIYEDVPPRLSSAQHTLAMSLQVFAKTDADQSFRPLGKDEALRSNVDGYYLRSQVRGDGYLYVFQVDARGKVDWLFPVNTCEFSSGQNPVTDGTIQIPDELKGSLYLDYNTGVEQIFAVFSAERWIALEEDLRAVVEQQPSAPNVAIAEPFQVRSRGVGGLAPPARDKPENHGDPPDNEPRLQQAKADFLVLKESFNHQ